MKTAMTFSDVVRERHCSSTNLAAQPKFLLVRQPLCHAVYCPPKFARDLINLQVFKRPITRSFVFCPLHRFNDSLQSLASNNPAFPGAVPTEPLSSRPPPFEQPCLLWQSVRLFLDNLREIGRRDFLCAPVPRV